MLSLFRSLHPFTYIILFFYGCAIKILFFFFPLEAPQLYKKYYSSASVVFEHNLYNFAITFICLYIQSIWFNRTVEKTKIFEHKNLGAGMVYLTVSSIFVEFNYFDLPVLVNFGLLFLLDQLLLIQNREEVLARFYNAGFVVGLLGLVHPDFFILIPLILVCLFAIKPILLRELLLYVLGVITPYYFLLGVGYLFDSIPEINIRQHFTQFRLAGIDLSQPRLIVLGVVTLALLFYGFIQNKQLTRFTSIKIKRTMDWILLFSIGLAVITAFSDGKDYGIFNYIIIPVSFYLSLFFFRIKKNSLAEFVHFVFLACIILFQVAIG